MRATWTEEREETEPLRTADGRQRYGEDGTPLTRVVKRSHPASRVIALDSSDLEVDLSLDERRKGLMWYPLYDVAFHGAWTFDYAPEHADERVRLVFPFPVQEGVYDDFSFKVNGVEMSERYPPSNGRVEVPVEVAPGETVAFEVGYRSRGMTEWTYKPHEQVAQLSDFSLHMTTDFDRIDFPRFTLSPESKVRTDDGWSLSWDFRRIVTGHGMGMVVPSRIQPGHLAASMSLSAPISLGLFMVWIVALGRAP